MKKNINNGIIYLIMLFVPIILFVLLILLGSLDLNYDYIQNYFDRDYLGMKGLKYYLNDDKARSIKYLERATKLGNKRAKEDLCEILIREKETERHQLICIE